MWRRHEKDGGCSACVCSKTFYLFPNNSICACTSDGVRGSALNYDKRYDECLTSHRVRELAATPVHIAHSSVVRVKNYVVDLYTSTMSTSEMIFAWQFPPFACLFLFAHTHTHRENEKIKKGALDCKVQSSYIVNWESGKATNKYRICA